MVGDVVECIPSVTWDALLVAVELRHLLDSYLIT